jgi:hypothetical protein
MAMAMTIRGSVFMLAAAMAAPVHAQVHSGGRVCGAIAVSSPDRPRARERFSATKTLDLQFRMRLTDADEDGHVVTFRVQSPKGHLYQEIRVAHHSEPGKGKRAASSISARLPLAGTSIATNTLYGKWRVTPYLDGSSHPCGVAAVFSIVK